MAQGALKMLATLACGLELDPLHPLRKSGILVVLGK